MADLKADWEISKRPEPPAVLRDLAAEAGVRFNGDAPWDIRVNDERVYRRILYRMWKYYMLFCAGFFRSRQGQLWQLVLSKRQRSGLYRSVR